MRLGHEARGDEERVDPGVLDHAVLAGYHLGPGSRRLRRPELGLDEPIDPQFPIQTPHGLRIVDLRVGRHFFEFHGTDKLLPASQGGHSAAAPREAIRAEQDRATDLRDLGFGLSDTYAPDLQGSRRPAAHQRPTREYTLSRERFGTEVPSRMLDFAARYRAHQRAA